MYPYIIVRQTNHNDEIKQFKTLSEALTYFTKNFVTGDKLYQVSEIIL